MKNCALCLLLSVVAVSLACGGALVDPMPLADCNKALTESFAKHCVSTTTGSAAALDCRNLDPKFAQCQSFERADVVSCTTNISNAADCDKAKAVACSIRCTNY